MNVLKIQNALCNLSDDLTSYNNDIILNVKSISSKHISVEELICSDFISNLFVKNVLFVIEIVNTFTILISFQFQKY